jgi:hypothetical protein
MKETFSEREIAIFVRMAMRTGMAQKIPHNMIAGINDYLRKQFYPSLSEKDITDIEDTIDFYKGEFQRNMMKGLLQSTGSKSFGFAGLKGLLGIKDETIEDLEQLKRDVALDRKKISQKDIEELEKKIKENVDKK